MGLAKIIHGKEKCIHLGNIYAKRDWGHAKDYVEMLENASNIKNLMILWLQQKNNTQLNFLLKNVLNFKNKD